MKVLVIAVVFVAMTFAVGALHVTSSREPARPSRHPRSIRHRPPPMTARARRGPDGGHIGSNTDRLLAAQRKRARRAERNLQIAGRRSSRHLENGQSPTARWWRRTARRRR